MGSFVVTKSDGGIVELMGLSADVSKLPEDVPTGSSAYCIDSGDLYIFCAADKTWHKQ